MAVSIESIVDGLTNLVLAIRHDGKLRQWFENLAKIPWWERRHAILEMGEQFKSEGKDTALVASVKALADPRIFEAARRTMRGSR